MIKEINICQKGLVEDVLKLQLRAYQVEADIIGYAELPPLKDNVKSLQLSGESFYGYYAGEELCGVLALKCEKGIIDIHRLVVNPKHFRKGIAQMLLNFLEKEFEYTLLKVATGSKNTPAIRFYLKNGFEQVDEVKVEENLVLSCFEKRS